ncbi:hypothetical protein [Rhodopila globiformis]|uniref:Uncharacterized protein n=1 Tax=Rhodopila globiformis TaxID=1071 RepID=A0A2S6NLF1_RHOGL|nr:hypothetical protein [Rhodopila globiformis]PPQ36087.1 hypothetical protein CCS01_05665 [Rhodopila globiformis]
MLQPHQYSIFMQHIIGVLLPYFCRCTRDLDAAAAEIVETLASYGVRTRAEFIKATQIIALSMVTLETLAESTAQDLSPSLRIRYRGCANSLTRTTVECEKRLERRLAGDSPGKLASEPAADTPPPPMATARPPATAQPSAADTARPANDLREPIPDLSEREPIPDLSEEEALAAIAQVRAQIDQHRARLSAKPPAPSPLPDPDHPAWGAAIMDAMKQGAAHATADPGG